MTHRLGALKWYELSGKLIFIFLTAMKAAGGSFRREKNKTGLTCV
jgi:hypothetical protein